MFLVLVDSNGKRVDERCWGLNEGKAALAALEDWKSAVVMSIWL